MESPIAIYQLCILYILHRTDGEIATSLISEFFLGNGYVNFASMSRTFQEIEQNGFAASLERGGKTFLLSTPEGEQTLHFFEDQIPDVMKQQADQYLREKGKSIRDDKSLVAEYYASSNGGYIAHLAVRENQTILVEVDLSMPSEESAKAVCRHWKERSSGVYQYLIEKLL